MSSANSLAGQRSLDGRSFTWTKNNGPCLDPWGTPSGLNFVLWGALPI